ncbi:hypothetical protein GTY67_11155 [Streptomyces sp. SID8374]|uniref:hypothetical protein n=1 Tax=unclassified Streptomyces TaxID=2593676 RepID=UPI00081DD4A1|nr:MULTISPECIES: hypothetical protein [unclassified Streptomyces]MYR94197.1 hypothetical protein [Streptomyces sp. SID4937]MYX13964.1 hypothetical protein [Streptomyces sp. SID8374]SCD66782.1 hypothetical protein GA0115243_1037238 [Streptomyces sp. ScaeMP-e83]
MASRRHQRLVLATAATMLTLTTAVGCAGLDKALDCVRTADAVATSVGNLQRAVSSASGDITQASEALDDIDRELKNLDGATDNADLSKAVDDLQAGVANVRESIESGDATPDITPVTNAATEIGKVCTP